MKSFLSKIKNCFKNAQVPFIMTILNFIIFLILTIESLYYGYGSIVVFLFAIPFIGFLVLTLLANKFKDKYFKIISNIISILLIPVLGIYFIITIAVEAFYMIQNPVIDVKYYENYYNGHSLEKAFPETIPDDAINVQFQHSPRLLQVGEEYSLYYIDNDITLAKFDEKYKEKAEWIGKEEEYDLKPGLLAGAFAYTPIEFDSRDDFTIYLIESKTDDSGYSNHGYFLFAAINEETKEVVYRLSDW